MFSFVAPRTNTLLKVVRSSTGETLSGGVPDRVGEKSLMDDLDVVQDGVLCRRLVLQEQDLVERDHLPRERVLDVDLEWHLGRSGGCTGGGCTGRSTGAVGTEESAGS